MVEFLDTLVRSFIRSLPREEVFKIIFTVEVELKAIRKFPKGPVLARKPVLVTLVTYSNFHHSRKQHAPRVVLNIPVCTDGCVGR